MNTPRVYAAIAAITNELSYTGLAKKQRNEQSGYLFRSIDEVMAALSPLLAKYHLCILPRALERERSTSTGPGGVKYSSVALRVAYDLVSAEDGSLHTVEGFGEAMDASDKATSKAMSAAFKYVALQTFCVPIKGRPDADVVTHQLDSPIVIPASWANWTTDLKAMIDICESIEAITRLQASHRELLRMVSAADRTLYDSIGLAIQNRRAIITERSRGKSKKQVRSRRHPKANSTIVASAAEISEVADAS
jgi:hypothetical protein